MQELKCYQYFECRFGVMCGHNSCWIIYLYRVFSESTMQSLEGE